MSFYGDMAKTADGLIRQFGTTAKLPVTSHVVDPDDPTNAIVTTKEHEIQVVVFDYPERMIDGTLIQRGDKQAFASVLGGVEPEEGQQLKLGAVTYSIVSLKSLSPALVPVLWEFQLRGAS